MSFDYENHPLYPDIIALILENQRDYFTRISLPAFIEARGEGFGPQDLEQLAAILPLIPEEERRNFTLGALPAFIKARGENFDLQDLEKLAAMLPLIPEEGRFYFIQSVLPAFIYTPVFKYASDKSFTLEVLEPLADNYATILLLIAEEHRDNFTQYTLPQFIRTCGKNFGLQSLEQLAAILALIPEKDRYHFTRNGLSDFIKARGENFGLQDLEQLAIILPLIPEGDLFNFTAFALRDMVRAGGKSFGPEALVQLATILPLIPERDRISFSWCALPTFIKARGENFDLQDLEELAAILPLIPEGQRYNFIYTYLPALIKERGKDFCIDSMAALAPIAVIDGFDKLPHERISAIGWLLQDSAENPSALKNALKHYNAASNRFISDTKDAAMQHDLALLNECAKCPDFELAFCVLKGMDPIYWGAFNKITDNAQRAGAIITTAMAVAEYCDETGCTTDNAMQRIGDIKKLNSLFEPRQLKDYLVGVSDGIVLPLMVLRAMQDKKCDYETAVQHVADNYPSWEDLEDHLARLSPTLFQTVAQTYEGNERWHQGGAGGALAIRRWDALPVPEPQDILDNAGKRIGRLVITPLTRTEDLATESAHMQHCVGWFNHYVDSCTMGYGKIFSHLVSVRIECDDEQQARAMAKQLQLQDTQVAGQTLYLSTAELRETGDAMGMRTFTIRQNHGFKNSTAPASAVECIDNYMAQLNADELEPDWQQIDNTRAGFRFESLADQIKARVGTSTDDSPITESLLFETLRRTMSGCNGTLGATLPKRMQGKDLDTIWGLLFPTPAAAASPTVCTI